MSAPSFKDPGENPGAFNQAFTNLWAIRPEMKDEPVMYMYTIGGVTKPVIDGDLTDYRPDDVKGCIVGLRAKGDARGDTSGFVRPAHQTTFLTSRG